MYESVIYVALILCFIQLGVNSIKEDYYWRDYTGEIPPDAIVGGKDINGENTYMGQAHIKDYGLIPTQIFPGHPEVKLPMLGVKTVDVGIKILCSRYPNAFLWLPSTSTKLHLDMIDKHAVIGGLEGGRIINFGRISVEGGITIGKILGYNAGNAVMYYVNKDKEVTATSYEVLTYNLRNILDVRDGPDDGPIIS